MLGIIGLIMCYYLYNNSYIISRNLLPFPQDLSSINISALGVSSVTLYRYFMINLFAAFVEESLQVYWFHYPYAQTIQEFRPFSHGSIM